MSEFGGIGKDPWGNQKAGFTITGKIKRTDFKLNWNAALETGGVLVGEEVKLQAEIQLVKQALVVRHHITSRQKKTRFSIVFFF
jgi:hypothetical protein